MRHNRRSNTLIHRCGAETIPETARYSRYDYCRRRVSEEGQRCPYHLGKPPSPAFLADERRRSEEADRHE